MKLKIPRDCLVTYSPRHPEKSLIFLGTRLTSSLINLLREGGV